MGFGTVVLPMVQTLQILTILLAAVGMALSLAHALEYPGKRRLDGNTYFKVQAIYYPGFTIGGVSEPVALIAVFALLLFMPFGTAAFWLTAAALAGLLLAHAIYWAITHPVNKVWLKDQNLQGAGSAFFAAGGGVKEGDWAALRDRWEYSHVARAVLAMLSLIALVVAAVRPA
ncbi:MAG TPA: DUF1772 domain-containing protein [Reyranella sp.]|nr:DUF1772 domain-containing protein [Reyranella sp.]